MNKASSLSGKVIWLTGASTGIGAAVAKALAQFDCTLALTARNEEKLQSLIASMPSPNAKLKAFPGDVSEKHRMQEIAAAIEGEFSAVDILIANAGTNQSTEVTSFDTAEYERLFKVNYFGALYCIEAVLPAMIRRKSGYIVAVSSVAGYRGLPGAASYCASKSALTTFLESLRFDLLEHQVDVTVVSPGFVRTPLTDKNTFNMPFLIEPEVAAAHIVRGLIRRPYEIHFPKIFTFMLKFLRVLPFPLYHAMVRNYTR